jgi:hypothetical protein
MTNDQFSTVFSKYTIEAKACLWPKDDYAWADRERTLKMMSNLLGEIPESLYPKDIEGDNVILRSGDWRLDLMRMEDGVKAANLSYTKDDHTAWVAQDAHGEWMDFDIGGS